MENEFKPNHWDCNGCPHWDDINGCWHEFWGKECMIREQEEDNYEEEEYLIEE